MSPIEIPELFYYIQLYLTDKETVNLLISSKIIYNYRSLSTFNFTYNLSQIHNKWCETRIKNIYIDSELSLDTLVKNNTFKLKTHPNYVKLLSKNNIIVPSKYYEFCAQLLISHGYDKIAEEILFNGDYSMKNINKLFISSSKSGYLALSQLLVKLGANVKDRKNEAFVSASKFGHVEVVQFLITMGAKVRVPNNDAIVLASENGHLKVVELLVLNGANVHSRNNEAIKIAYNNNHMNVVEFLIKYSSKSVLNSHVIYWMLKEGNLKMVELLIETCVNITGKNNFIVVAAEYGWINIIKLLMTKGIDFSLQKNEALKIACEKNNKEMINFLIDMGANVDYCILIHAVRCGSFEIVRLLIDNGADVNAGNNKIIISAIENNRLEIVSLLISKGANIMDNEVIITALKYCRWEIVELLIKNGAKLPFNV